MQDKHSVALDYNCLFTISGARCFVGIRRLSFNGCPSSDPRALRGHGTDNYQATRQLGAKVAVSRGGLASRVEALTIS